MREAHQAASVDLNAKITALVYDGALRELGYALDDRRFHLVHSLGFFRRIGSAFKSAGKGIVKGAKVAADWTNRKVIQPAAGGLRAAAEWTAKAANTIGEGIRDVAEITASAIVDAAGDVIDFASSAASFAIDAAKAAYNAVGEAVSFITDALFDLFSIRMNFDFPAFGCEITVPSRAMCRGNKACEAACGAATLTLGLSPSEGEGYGNWVAATVLPPMLRVKVL